jgi:hypothetical protein
MRGQDSGADLGGGLERAPRRKAPASKIMLPENPSPRPTFTPTIFDAIVCGR